MFLVNGLRISEHSMFRFHESVVFLCGCALPLSLSVERYSFFRSVFASVQKLEYLIYYLEKERDESSDCIDTEIIKSPKSFQTHGWLPEHLRMHLLPTYYNGFM